MEPRLQRQWLVCLIQALVPTTLLLATAALAQDNVRGSVEPIVSAIDVGQLRYDILVDGDLAQDDAAKHQFKTLQAAYAAAAEGTPARPTVIGIKPNVYLLSGTGSRRPSMSITKNYLTLLGLTNNRRAVVLADNRGLQQGADDNGYILDVNAIGFTLKNLTVINYCNTDYEYPGDASKNLTRRSDVITQAVALQAAGDKHIYDNVALLGRLDTLFLRTARSYWKHVYVEGTDDWIGGGQLSYWDDCTLVFPRGSGVMSASNAVFRNCRFEATHGMQFYKAEFAGAERPNAVIDSIVPATSAASPVAWVRGKLQPRPSVYSLTFRNKDSSGNAAAIYDSNLGQSTFTYARELSAAEERAFNPWNLLRATPAGVADDWDPAGVRQQYEASGAGNLVYRMALTGNGATIRTGDASTTLTATLTPARVADTPISWATTSELVTLSAATGPSVVVTARNNTGQTQWVPINASATNGFYVTAYVQVQPAKVSAPALTAAPRISAPANGTVTLAYALDLRGHADQSLLSWFLCDDPACTQSREVAVSRGAAPMTTLVLLPGFAAKYLKAVLQPKVELSEAGPAVVTISSVPIANTAIPAANVVLNARSFVTTAVASRDSGLWSVTGPWSVVAADEFVDGYGLRSGNTPGTLLYQDDTPRGDMQLDLVMTPDKFEGQGFSIPGSPVESDPLALYADVYIKYDAQTRNGYALRFWRTTLAANKCMFQLYRIVDGIGVPLDERQQLSGVLKPNTTMTVLVTGNKLVVDAANSTDAETLHLEATITPNRFGGAGVYWPRGSANVYSRLAIRYSRP